MVDFESGALASKVNCKLNGKRQFTNLLGRDAPGIWLAGGGKWKAGEWNGSVSWGSARRTGTHTCMVALGAKCVWGIFAARLRGEWRGWWPDLNSTRRAPPPPRCRGCGMARRPWPDPAWSRSGSLCGLYGRCAGQWQHCQSIFPS